MINLTFDTKDLQRLEKATRESRRKLPRELSIAINATAKKASLEMSKEVRTELAASAKAVKTALKITRKAEPNSLGSTVTLKRQNRIPLRDFKANQTRTGVAYRISKTDGRKTVAGAFQGPTPKARLARWRGHVFKRKGRARLPIIKLFGPSPWGVFVNRKMDKPVAARVEQELSKQINRRIQFNVFKASQLT